MLLPFSKWASWATQISLALVVDYTSSKFLSAHWPRLAQFTDCSAVIPEPPALNDKIEFPPQQFLSDIQQSVSSSFSLSRHSYQHTWPSVLKPHSLTSPPHQVSILISWLSYSLDWPFLGPALVVPEMYVYFNIPHICFLPNTSIVLRPTMAATTLKSYCSSLHNQGFLLNIRYIYSFVFVFMWEANVVREYLFGTSIYIFIFSTPMNSVKGWDLCVRYIPWLVNGCICLIIQYVISTAHLCESFFKYRLLYHTTKYSA